MTLYEEELARGRKESELKRWLLEAIKKTLVDVMQRGVPPDQAAGDLRDQVLDVLDER